MVRCLGIGLFVLALPMVAEAAPDRTLEAGHPAPTGVELIAFEAPGCRYCPVFRRDVVPTYGMTRAGKSAPLRFVDVNDLPTVGVKLTAPVTTVPTLVLVRDGVEIGRIAGYVGREATHRLLETLLPAQ